MLTEYKINHNVHVDYHLDDGWINIDIVSVVVENTTLVQSVNDLALFVQIQCPGLFNVSA